MSTHNIGFHTEIKPISIRFGLQKVLSKAMDIVVIFSYYSEIICFSRAIHLSQGDSIWCSRKAPTHYTSKTSFLRTKLVEPSYGFPTDHSKAILLLQFFFVSASVVSNVAFVLSLFVPHLPFFWCLGKAVLLDCGISRVSSLIFLPSPLITVSQSVLKFYTPKCLTKWHRQTGAV